MSLVRPLSLIAAMAVLALGVLALLILPVRAQDASVSMENVAFVPSSVTISEGDTVTWTNNDGDVPHNVTSTDGGPLASDNLSDGETYSFTFAEPGTYAYECTIHPGMTGSVTVEAAMEDDDNGVVDDDDDAMVDDDDAVDDDTAPPATGTGTASGSGSTSGWLFMAAAVAILVAGGGFIGLRVARSR